MEHMGTVDIIVHIVELVVAVVVVPSIRQLITVLISLNRSIAVLNIQITSLYKDFEEHKADDEKNFKVVREDFREIKGLIYGQWEQRRASDRDGHTA